MTILATVSGPEGFRRPVTDDDALWCGRMLLGESGHYAWDTNEGRAVLWTTLNRWVQTAVNRALPPMSLGEFAQRYSTAIDPNRLQGGSRDTSPEETENERQRAVRRGLGWNQMPTALRKVVYAVLTGRVPAGPYAGLVHYGTPGDVHPESSWLGPVTLPDVPGDSNEFYRMAQTVGWTSGTVTVQADRPIVRAASVGILLGVLAVGVYVGTRFHARKRR